MPKRLVFAIITVKWCLALISVCVFIGCAAPPQLQCTGKDGQIVYLGPYDEEHASEYVVRIDDRTREFYRKSACRKVEFNASPAVASRPLP